MFEVSRRAFVGGSLATASAMALPGKAWASTSTVPTVPLVNFYSSLGVVGHPWYTNGLWPQRLNELDIRNFRAKLGQDRDAVTKLGTFFANGGKVNSTIVQSNNGVLDKIGAQKSLDFLKNYVGLQHVGGIEGPNEFNDGHPANWATTLRDFVHWTHDTVRADASFQAVPLIAPSIWMRILSDYQALGDVSQWVDKGCIHYYSGRRRPTLTGGNGGTTMQGSLRDASIIAPGKPIWMTESGWQAPYGNVPVSLRAQAKYVLRDYFDAFGCGVEKLFMYQLIDDQSNLFGLCDAYANPKPAFSALKNLTALVKDQYARSGSLGYSISGAPTSLKSFSFSKSDGSFLLVLYLDVDSYDPRTGRDLESSVPVTVTLSGAAQKIDVFQPTFSSEAFESASGNSVALLATDHLTVLRISF